MIAAVRFANTAVPSPLEGVSASAWRAFVTVLAVQPTSAISRCGGLGAYNIRPRRLVELGRATNFRRIGNRKVCDFIEPWTQKRFLSDRVAQDAVLVKSMRAYYSALRDGSIKKPEDVSMSGALVLLHSGGRGALENWTEMFDGTKSLYELTKGLF
jgi:hypothetical protein